MADVLIIGGGIAGLAAADTLAHRDREVIILEARDRIGGRILTVPSASGKFPIELGAEFIHGASNSLWPTVRELQMKVQEVPNRHWLLSNRGLSEQADFYDAIEKVVSKVHREGPDLSFADFLKTERRRKPSEHRLAREYVEGFHAADPPRVSAKSISEADAAAEQAEGDRQFRIEGGYRALLDWYQGRLERRPNVQLELATRVKRINWEPGHVEFIAEGEGQPRTFSAASAVITLPIGVLAQRGNRALRFEPPLESKEDAIAGMEMGFVIKLVMEFHEAFWPERNFGFIHAVGHPIATWWSDERGPVLTGWAAGPRAQALAHAGYDDIRGQAIEDVAHLFKLEPRFVEEMLVKCHYHDWIDDPFSLGAYSFIRVAKTGMPKKLAEPLDNTLFFAGEATAKAGEQGTVHGAAATGQRAAEEVMRALTPYSLSR